MSKKKVLIAVKTYPTLSGKYDELVCTAGFLEDGSWIRIYPVPFRKMEYDQRYKKYDWVEFDLVKNTRDFRPESYRPYSIESDIDIVGHVDTDDYWEERKRVVLNNVYTDLSQLIADAKDKSKCVSLAVFKPTEFIDFVVESTTRDWDKKKINQLKANRDQQNLFEHPEDPFEVVKKLPYVFRYKFKDDKGKISTPMIEDWEIGQLFWNCLRKYKGDEDKAIADVKKRYFDDFAKTKDLYLFLGTSQVHHYTSHNPFMIIGTFHPKHRPAGMGVQTTLFD